MRTICVLLLVVAVAMGGAIYFVYHLKQQPFVVDKTSDPVRPDPVLPTLQPKERPEPSLAPKKHFIMIPKWSEPVKLKSR